MLLASVVRKTINSIRRQVHDSGMTRRSNITSPLKNFLPSSFGQAGQACKTSGWNTFIIAA
jgi:hypothetical protein